MLGFDRTGTYWKRQTDPQTRMDAWQTYPIPVLSAQPVYAVQMTQNGFERMATTLIRIPEAAFAYDFIPQPGDKLQIQDKAPLTILRVTDCRRGYSLAHWRLEAD